MEVETPIAESIRSIDKNAQIDAACKQVLAIRIILAWIMKSCLEEFRDYAVNEIAEKYIRKGSRLLIEGKLRTRTWQDLNTLKHTITEIYVDTFEILR